MFYWEVNLWKYNKIKQNIFITVNMHKNFRHKLEKCKNLAPLCKREYLMQKDIIIYYIKISR